MSIKNTSPDIISNLYKFIGKTDEILGKINIPYFIFAGTLLGAVRHRDIIPWDDDIDIAIMDLYENDIWNNRHIFKENGLNITKYKFGYKVFNLDSKIDPKWNHGYPFLDIFIMSDYLDNGVEKIQYKDEEYRSEFSNECFSRIDIFPLTQYILKNIKVTGPNNYKPLLNKFYGHDWGTCYKTHNLCHVTKQYKQPMKVTL